MSDYDEYQTSRNYNSVESWAKGDLALDRDGNYIERWPSKISERRGVSVEISTWVGTDHGAKHFKISIEEVDNQFWSEKRNMWVRVLCHNGSRGLSLDANVLSAKDAVKLAKTYMKMIDHTGKTHVFVWRWTGSERPRWIRR
jgi:hypothetical protein